MAPFPSTSAWKPGNLLYGEKQLQETRELPQHQSELRIADLKKKSELRIVQYNWKFKWLCNGSMVMHREQYSKFTRIGLDAGDDKNTKNKIDVWI